MTGIDKKQESSPPQPHQPTTQEVLKHRCSLRLREATNKTDFSRMNDSQGIIYLLKNRNPASCWDPEASRTVSKTPNIAAKRPRQLRERQKKPWDEISLIPSCRMRPLPFFLIKCVPPKYYMRISGSSRWRLCRRSDFQSSVPPQRTKEFIPDSRDLLCLPEGSPFKFRWSDRDNNQCDYTAKNNLFHHRMTFVWAILYLFLDEWIFGQALRFLSQRSWCPRGLPEISFNHLSLCGRCSLHFHC